MGVLAYGAERRIASRDGMWRRASEGLRRIAAIF
jgi:hypothetical protein